MTEENKPVPAATNGQDAVHTGEGTADGDGTIEGGTRVGSSSLARANSATASSVRPSAWSATAYR